MGWALAWRARGSLGPEGRRTLVIHLDYRLTGPFYTVQDLLVFDLQFGISLRLAAYFLPVGMVLT